MKWIGCALVMGGCWGIGFAMAARDKAQERSLSQLEQIFGWMIDELSCRMWPLNTLFQLVAEMTDGDLKHILLSFSLELDKRSEKDATDCMKAVLEREQRIPPQCKMLLGELGKSLGRYDLSGQIRELERIRSQANRLLLEHRDGSEQRLRSYKTLGLCAGAVLMIILL